MKCDVRMCRVAKSKITNFGYQNREFGEFKIKLQWSKNTTVPKRRELF